MLKGFRDFLMRGNVVDLAVAVVIGAAFGLLVSAFVKDLITPLIAAIAGRPDFSAFAFTINGSRFAYGDFLNALLAFVLVAAAVYYAVVVPMGKLTAAMRKRDQVEAAVMRPCQYCLESVPAAATKCRACGSEIGIAA